MEPCCYQYPEWCSIINKKINGLTSSGEKNVHHNKTLSSGCLRVFTKGERASKTFHKLKKNVFLTLLYSQLAIRNILNWIGRLKKQFLKNQLQVGFLFSMIIIFFIFHLHVLRKSFLSRYCNEIRRISENKDSQHSEQAVNCNNNTHVRYFPSL